MKRADEANPFESLNNIRPHQLGQGITARAIEAERMTIAVSISTRAQSCRSTITRTSSSAS